ncbi:hypothetical protein P7C70_g7760, partial [Phenoliferia sp. Uapishka_3]
SLTNLSPHIPPNPSTNQSVQAPIHPSLNPASLPSAHPSNTVPTSVATGFSTTTSAALFSSSPGFSPAVISYDLVTPNGNWDHSVLVPARQAKGKGKFFTESPQWALVTGTKRPRFGPEGEAVGHNKSLSRRCQGVGLCTRASCVGIARPSVPLGKCMICDSPLRHETCTAVWWIQDVPGSEDTKRVWHEGQHHHRVPPALHVGAEATAALVNLHHSRPLSTPAGLRQGCFTSQPEHPLSHPSSVKLHPKFSSLDVMKRTLPSALGPSAGPSSSRSGDIKHFEIKELNTKVNGFIVKSHPNGMLFLQTPMMRRWMSDETQLSRRISVAGMCTDGNMSFLREKHVAQVTVCFSPPLRRWVPVAYATMTSQTADDFAVYFSWVIESMEEERFTTEEILDQIRHVLDYSPAQANGFDNAIVEWYVRTKRRVEPVELSTPEHEAQWRQDGQVIAASRRRGCEQHFEGSARRIMANSFVVPPTLASSFFAAAKAFQNSHTKESRAARLADLIREFPKAEGWVRWWTAGKAEEMILRSSMTMSVDDQQEIPVTTNPVETNHGLLNLGTGATGLSLAEGIVKIYDFVQMMELSYDAALGEHFFHISRFTPSGSSFFSCLSAAGYRSSHSSHSNVRERSGTSRPQPPAAFPPNNGKPPEKTLDLIDAITPAPSFVHLSPSKVKKYSGLAPSRESDAPPSNAVSGWTRGANVDVLDVVWNFNSCWLDSSLMAQTQLWTHENNGCQITGREVLAEILHACANSGDDRHQIQGLAHFATALLGTADVHSRPSSFSTIAEARAALTGVRDSLRNDLAGGHLGPQQAFISNPWGCWYDTIWEQALAHPYSNDTPRLPRDPKAPPTWTLPAHLIQENFVSTVSLEACPAKHARFSRHVKLQSTFDLDETFLPPSRTPASPPLDFQQTLNQLWNNWGASATEVFPCWRSIVVHRSGQDAASDVGLCDGVTCTRGKRILGLPFVLPIRISNSLNGSDISGQFLFPPTLVVKNGKNKLTWDLVARQNKLTAAGCHFTSTIRIAKTQVAVFDSMTDEPRSFASVTHYRLVGEAVAAVSGARELTAGVYYRFRGEPSTLATAYLARLEGWFTFTKLAYAIPTSIRYRTGFGPGQVDKVVPPADIYWIQEGNQMGEYLRLWLDVERSALEIKKLVQEICPAESTATFVTPPTGPSIFVPPVPVNTSAPPSAPPAEASNLPRSSITLSSGWVMRCTGCGEGSVRGDLKLGGRPSNLLECLGCRTWGHLECGFKGSGLAGFAYRCNICSSGRMLSDRRRKELEDFVTENQASFGRILSTPAIIASVEIEQRWYITRVVDLSFLLDPHGAFHIIYPPHLASAAKPVLFSSHHVVIDSFRRNSQKNRSRFKVRCGLLLPESDFEKPIDPTSEASYHERRLRVDPSPARVEVAEVIRKALSPSKPLLLQLLDSNSANPSIQSVPALERWSSIALGLSTSFDAPLSVIYGNLKIGQMEQIVSFVDDIKSGLIHDTWEWHCALEHCANLMDSYRRLSSDGDEPIDWDSPLALSTSYRLLLQSGSGANGRAGGGERGEPVMYNTEPDKYDKAYEDQLWVAAADAALHEPSLEDHWTLHGRNSFTNHWTNEYWRTYNGQRDLARDQHPVCQF